MIYDLNGINEIPKFRANTHLVVHDNNLYEDYPPHMHPAVEVIMPTEGEYSVIVNGNTYTANPYELIFIGSNTVHSTIAPKTGHRYFFQIDDSLLHDISGVKPILSFIGPVRTFTPGNSPDIHRQLIKLFEEICDSFFDSEEKDSSPSSCCDKDSSVVRGSIYPDINTEEANTEYDNSVFRKSILCEPIIYSKFLSMLGIIGLRQIDICENASHNQTNVKEYVAQIMTVCRYIDEHFTEELTLGDMAYKIGYSKFHFSRIFKQAANVSFYKYVNHRRIEHSQELLVNTDLAVSKIAVMCGFPSASSFIRMFKQINECTPTDYRERTSSGNNDRARQAGS